MRRYSVRSRQLDAVTWMANVVGMGCILWAKEHYTIDVVCAFALTIAKLYHDMADMGVDSEKINPLANMVQFFESNDHGRV